MNVSGVHTIKTRTVNVSRPNTIKICPDQILSKHVADQILSFSNEKYTDSLTRKHISHFTFVASMHLDGYSYIAPHVSLFSQVEHLPTPMSVKSAAPLPWQPSNINSGQFPVTLLASRLYFSTSPLLHNRMSRRFPHWRHSCTVQSQILPSVHIAGCTHARSPHPSLCISLCLHHNQHGRTPSTLHTWRAA